VPAPGTRGKVQLPRSRGAGAPAARPHLRPAPRREGAEGALPPPVFANHDDDWQAGEPLLARVRPVRPEEREPSLHGRSYAIFDATHASEGDRSDVFARLGTELVVENPFHHGGRLQADAEWNWRRVDVQDNDDEEGVQFRVERLSYATGGTRFEPEGLEVGRFLHEIMPEFGVLDGVQWTARTASGSRYGASVGFLPEPDEEFESGSDFQFAGFYRWVADESEELSASAGYQKTFHDGAADRDLFVTSLQRLPRDGWTFFGTLWLDAYTAGDDQKGTLFGLTQAYLSTGKRWASGSSLDLVYTHLEFPEMQRDEFLPVTDDQLADDHNERVSLASGLQLNDAVCLRTAVGAWVDQDDRGGDAELGFALHDFVFPGAFAEVAAFATRGSFLAELGARGSVGTATAGGGRLALDYEFTQNRLDGFSSANDDLPEHRLRLHGDHAWNSWNVSWRLEALVYDDENALTLGLYLQRTTY
jgi:hypothetical protein